MCNLLREMQKHNTPYSIKINSRTQLPMHRLDESERSKLKSLSLDCLGGLACKLGLSLALHDLVEHIGVSCNIISSNTNKT